MTMTETDSASGYAVYEAQVGDILCLPRAGKPDAYYAVTAASLTLTRKGWVHRLKLVDSGVKARWQDIGPGWFAYVDNSLVRWQNIQFLRNAGKLSTARLVAYLKRLSPMS